MDNLEDTDNHAKISDSAYSNSYSNSQSRSHSSKSTRSGSNSSGSSGYGGKPSTSGGSTNLGQPPEKRSKDAKKKKQVLSEITTVAETAAEHVEPKHTVTFISPQPEKSKETEAAAADIKKKADVKKKADNKKKADIKKKADTKKKENGAEKMDISSTERAGHEDSNNPEPSCHGLMNPPGKCHHLSLSCNGFSCVISMHDGVVIYTTSSLTTSLGFPKHMWIGRFFIDFVHPLDRNTFASQITNGLSLPRNVNGMQEKVRTLASSVSTTVCRIRRYRGLSTGFEVKERAVIYLPFLLKLSFKNISDEEGKVVYLVVQATQFVSAFKKPNEVLSNPIPFVIRHAANGNVEYIDPESVPYLGYLPQDLVDRDALLLYHPNDLSYLRHVYETLVKEGGVPCSKPYRMLAQNGDYVKVETEWSPFINPWSRKLEFVIGKHHIIEGPINPDVFQVQLTSKELKMSSEDKCKENSLREIIIRIMNEPAEVAKQHTTKRCHDLASFMERLIEEEPKNEEELRVDIQETDNSYFERDSVMLGGISPHHEYNDSKSSSETPLSYNQLNYNENLQRYFDSHQPYSYEDYNTVNGENILDLNPKIEPGRLSPMAQQSRDSYDLLSTSESSSAIRVASPIDMTDYQHLRLTEILLSKHNVEMEKKLVKTHRENRSSSKGEREKVSIENRQKKKEHLARCNSTLVPVENKTQGERKRVSVEIRQKKKENLTRSNSTTVLPAPVETRAQAHGLKRCSKLADNSGSHKHHCSSPREMRRKQTSGPPARTPQPAVVPAGYGGQFFSTNPVTNMNTFFVGVGIPQHMSVMSSIAAVPGMFPLYYASNPEAKPPGFETYTSNSQSSDQQKESTPCMMYGQALYGSPFIYSPMYQQMSYPLQENLMRQTLQFSNSFTNPIATSSKTSSDQKFASNAVAVADRMTSSEGKSKTRHEDRTDGESSYSSFYSSFFKTDSGSAEESGETKKQETIISSNSYYSPDQSKKVPKRKMEPPWMEQVCVTSELIYKYQIFTKSLDEVLQADKQKMSTLEQPSLVNEQLGQLYMDLQLEGVAARLTLEEGITSSSSSGEESSHSTKTSRRKREYSKLVFIYEEETPLPPPPAEEDNPQPGPSTDASQSY